MAYVIRPADRAVFKRCRRAWDFGSPTRGNHEPDQAPPLDVDRAVRDALAVYYFPGMWEWDRSIVRPLALEGFQRSVDRQVAARRAAGRGRHREGGNSDRSAIDERRGQEEVGRARRLLDLYFDWAPAVDRFEPIRTETDFSVRIPNPTDPRQDLATVSGEPIQYEGRIDLLVVDRGGNYWMVDHRVASGVWADPDHLVLDERSASFCWAWELFYLGMTITGVIYNELRTDPAVLQEGGRFVRRTRVRRGRAELERLRAQMAHEALDMADPATRVYPAPSLTNCRDCAYRQPCIAVNRGAGAEEALAGYRQRSPEKLEEGRLGGVTWSTGRGAAPPRFKRQEDG